MKKTFDIILLNGFMYAVGIKVGTYHTDSACVKQVSGEWIFSASYFGRILCPPILMTNDPSLGLPLLPAVEEENMKTASQAWKTAKEHMERTGEIATKEQQTFWMAGYISALAKKYTDQDLLELSKIMERRFVDKQTLPYKTPTQVVYEFIQSITPKPKQVEVEMVDEVVAGSKTGLPFFSEPGKEVPRYSGLGRWMPVVDAKGFVKVIRWIY